MNAFFTLSAGKWAIAAISSFMVGLTKTGIPGLGVLFVPLYAMALPARVSTGAVLPLLIAGDIFAVTWYRRNAVWRHVVRPLPWAVAGIVLGFFAMGKVNDAQLRPILGAIIILMLAVNLWRDLASRNRQVEIPSFWWFAAIIGLLAGFTTMVANAAGPVMMIYLLAMRLPKKDFIGTSAWFFAIVNLIKVPFSVGLGLITSQSLLFDAKLAGVVIVGAVLGVLVAKRLPEKAFAIVVQALAFVSAVLLFF
jgi:uncharacterized protein